MEMVKKAVWPLTLILVIGLGIAALIVPVSNEDKAILPPTSMLGHIEESPESHILTEPMTEKVFRHMLEHSDGDDNKGPGVIISYNCIDFECDDDLIPSLEVFTNNYDYVYLAPFKDMTEMLVITALDRQDIIKEYSEEKIIQFIEQDI